MKRFLMLLVATMALTACKTVKIENGEVPDEYLARAKQLEGVYHGSFEGRSGQLTITFEGNKPLLLYKDSRGDSLLATQCRSSVNNLKWAYVTRKGAVESVGFYFDPGLCMIDGREVQLSFSKDYRSIRLSLLERRYMERRCRWEGGGPNFPPREVCDYVQNDINLYGKFSR